MRYADPLIRKAEWFRCLMAYVGLSSGLVVAAAGCRSGMVISQRFHGPGVAAADGLAQAGPADAGCGQEEPAGAAPTRPVLDGHWWARMTDLLTPPAAAAPPRPRFHPAPVRDVFAPAETAPASAALSVDLNAPQSPRAEDIPAPEADPADERATPPLEQPDPLPAPSRPPKPLPAAPPSGDAERAGPESASAAFSSAASPAGSGATVPATLRIVRITDGAAGASPARGDVGRPESVRVSNPAASGSGGQSGWRPRR